MEPEVGPVNVVVSEIRESDVALLEDQGKPAVGRSFADEYADQCRGEQSIYLATDGGRLLGSGFIRWLGPRDADAHDLFPLAPEIFRLEVVETRRSQGIGTRLLDALCAAATAQGFPAVSLGVAHANPRAHALYRRLGFEETPLTEYYDEYQYPLEDGGGRGCTRSLPVSGETATPYCTSRNRRR